MLSTTTSYFKHMCHLIFTANRINILCPFASEELRPGEAINSPEITDQEVLTVRCGRRVQLATKIPIFLIRDDGC